MLWLKSLHIIFMVTWFAGLFYLPRLFVYHSQVDAVADTPSDARFKVMERKLFWGIMTPGAALTTIFGVWMLSTAWDAYLQQTWMIAKLLAVAALIVYHVWCGKLVGDFANGINRHNHNWYRWFNEVPTAALIGIVILAVVKP